MKLKVSEDQYLEYIYTLKPNDHMLGFSVRSQGLSGTFNSNQAANFEWDLKALRQDQSITFENRYTRLSYEYDGDKTSKLSQAGEDEEDLENVSWISLFIALAPMLGFMGTVIGMIQAFDKIQAAGDMQPSLVAGGIKVALLTTVFGLIVAIILQVFYNYIIAKIDSIVNDMVDASITLIDILVAHKK